MKRCNRFATLSLAAAAAAVAFTPQAEASPARLITSPPVQKGPNPFTGPPNDSLAAQGQWFQRNSTQQLDVREYEFYDNNDQPGQTGGFMIRGVPTNIQIFGPPTNPNLIGFSLVTTITNDLGPPDQGVPGRNLHDEFLLPGNNYVGTMYDVKMTCDFALPSQVQVPLAVLNQIAANSAPYSAPDYGNGNVALITAQNEDQEGWYCYTPPNGTGGFYVPTYDFGTILPGQSVTRTLNFSVAAGVGPGHPLFTAIQSWAANQTDVLMNRTSDLKIGDWLDVLAADSGAPYPGPAFNAGNVGVFFSIPEPGAIAALVPLGLAALRRRASK
jgi:hypothetical protein